MSRDTDSERIKDIGLIGNKVKEKIREISEQQDRKVVEIIDNAYSNGLAYYLENESRIESEKSKKFVEDVYTYKDWQLNVYDSINRNGSQLKWSEVKTSILKKGLDQMS